MADDPIGGIWRERRALSVGVLLAIAVFAVDGMGVVPVLPLAVRDLGGLPLFGWAFAGFQLAWLAGTVAAGLVADARGPRGSMLVGLGAFAGGLVVAALAPSMAVFIAGRVLQGLGGGGMLAAAYVAIARGYPDALRARIMALTSSVWMIPALIGPAAAGAMAQRCGWRWLFAAIVPLLAIVAVMLWQPLRPLSIRQPLGDTRRLVDALRAAVGAALWLAAASLHALWLALVLLALGGLLLVPALRRLLPAGTFRAARGLPAGLVVRAVVALAFYGTEAFVPLAAAQLKGISATRAGLALTGGALGWVAGAWLTERTPVERRARIVASGFVTIAAGIAVVGLGLCTPAPWPLVPFGWALAGGGMGLTFSAGGLVCIAAVPSERAGEVAGQLQIAEALGTAIGTGALGAAIAALEHQGQPPRLAHAAAVVATLVAALAGAALAPRLRAAT